MKLQDILIEAVSEIDDGLTLEERETIPQDIYNTITAVLNKRGSKQKAITVYSVYLWRDQLSGNMPIDQAKLYDEIVGPMLRKYNAEASTSRSNYLAGRNWGDEWKFPPFKVTRNYKTPWVFNKDYDNPAVYKLIKYLFENFYIKNTINKISRAQTREEETRQRIEAGEFKDSHFRAPDAGVDGVVTVRGHKIPLQVKDYTVTSKELLTYMNHNLYKNGGMLSSRGINPDIIQVVNKQKSKYNISIYITSNETKITWLPID